MKKVKAQLEAENDALRAELAATRELLATAQKLCSDLLRRPVTVPMPYPMPYPVPTQPTVVPIWRIELPQITCVNSVYSASNFALGAGPQ